jgi:putative N6-adenine-specific DNA methylase
MHACYAITAPGLEHLTAAELRAVGAVVGVVEPGGVSFEAAPGILYAANLQLRTASRLVMRIAQFHAVSFAELEQHARKVAWQRWVPPDGAVHFRVTSRKSRLYHQEAVAERLERAVAAAVAGVRAVRAPSEADRLDDAVTALPGVQRFLVRIVDDELVLSVDSSGSLLHRRGYRQDAAKAPLRETLASALLLACRWDGTAPLVDPMCGSGTIPIEAALLARRIPPGWQRRFAFERWPEFKPSVLEYVRGQAASAIREHSPISIVASDRDAGAIEATLSNAERAGVTGDLSVRRAALTTTLSDPDVAALGPGLVLTNPPYGVRVGDSGRLRDLYASLGNAMRGSMAGWSLGFVTSDPALAAASGVPVETTLETTTGGLRIRLYTSAGREPGSSIESGN